jgi:hypothetical protein
VCTHARFMVLLVNIPLTVLAFIGYLFSYVLQENTYGISNDLYALSVSLGHPVYLTSFFAPMLAMTATVFCSMLYSLVFKKWAYYDKRLWIGLPVLFWIVQNLIREVKQYLFPEYYDTHFLDVLAGCLAGLAVYSIACLVVKLSGE